MSKDQYIDLLSQNWPLPVILIFLFGVGVGILLNRAMSSSEEEQVVRREGPPDVMRATPQNGSKEEGSLNEDAEDTAPLAVGGDRFAAIDRELAQAKAALAELNNDQEEAGKELDALDEALKRANGRLKVILNSLGKDDASSNS